MGKLLKFAVALMFGISSFAYASETYSQKGYTAKMKEYLISAEEAIGLIGAKNVVFVSGDSDETYEIVGHIVGSEEMYAHHLHHSELDGSMRCAPLLMCIDEAEEFISSKGITNDTFVIAYDDFKGPNATGVWLFFKHYGHDNVKVLNGGMAAIMALDKNQVQYDKYRDEIREYSKEIREAKKANDNKKVATLEKKVDTITKLMKELEPKLLVQKGKATHTTKKTNYTIDDSKVRLDLVATKEEVLEAVKDIQENGDNSKFAIIDSRRMGEVMGEVKLDNVARGGHIPGSTIVEWTNISDVENKLSFKQLEQMQKVFDKYGITKDKTIYPYCHVGAGRSTEFQVALKLLGYENVKTYTGCWDERGNDQNLPISR